MWNTEKIIRKARETGNIPGVEDSVPSICDIHSAQATVHGDIIRLIERLMMASPAPGQQPPTISDESRQLLLRIKNK